MRKSFTLKIVFLFECQIDQVVCFCYASFKLPGHFESILADVLFFRYISIQLCLSLLGAIFSGTSMAVLLITFCIQTLLFSTCGSNPFVIEEVCLCFY